MNTYILIENIIECVKFSYNEINKISKRYVDRYFHLYWFNVNAVSVCILIRSDFVATIAKHVSEVIYYVYAYMLSRIKISCIKKTCLNKMGCNYLLNGEKQEISSIVFF